MPIPISDAVDDQTDAAATKAAASRNLPRYLVSSALAGVFVGMAVVLLVSVSAPLAATDSAATKLVQAAVFGIALTLVVFAGAELFTGNAMVMLQGWWQRTVGAVDLGRVWALSLVGNLVGSVLLALIVHAGGTLTGPGADLVAKVIATKGLATGPQLFWRAVLCNALVCLALWMAARTRADGAKLAVLWWALLAFIGSGFEHSIANMTMFSLGALEGTSSWGAMWNNLVWTVPGNVVGGGLVIGIGYAWLNGRRPSSSLAPIVPTVSVAANGTSDQAPADAAELVSNAPR